MSPFSRIRTTPTRVRLSSISPPAQRREPPAEPADRQCIPPPLPAKHHFRPRPRIQKNPSHLQPEENLLGPLRTREARRRPYSRGILAVVPFLAGDI